MYALWTGRSLVLTWCVFSTRPLPHSKLIHCQVDIKQHDSAKLELKYNNFRLRNYTSKCCLPGIWPFHQPSMCEPPLSDVAHVKVPVTTGHIVGITFSVRLLQFSGSRNSGLLLQNIPPKLILNSNLITYILHMTYFPVAQSFKNFVQGVILCNKMYIMNALYII